MLSLSSANFPTDYQRVSPSLLYLLLSTTRYEEALPAASTAKSIRDEHPALQGHHDHAGGGSETGGGGSGGGGGGGGGLHPERAAALAAQLALLERCGRAGGRVAKERAAQARSLAAREARGEMDLQGVWRDAMGQNQPPAMPPGVAERMHALKSSSVCWFKDCTTR